MRLQKRPSEPFWGINHIDVLSHMQNGSEGLYFASQGVSTFFYIMRRVKIYYNDGTTAAYNTIEEAARALHCSNPAIQRMANGLSTTLIRAHGIKSVELSGSKTCDGGVRKRGGRYHVRCENEITHEVIIAKTLKEAAELTHWPRTVTALHYACDRGEYRHGWKYDSIPLAMQKEQYGFDQTVPTEAIDFLYRVARHMLITWTLPTATKEDMVAYAVTHATCDLATGKYDGKAQASYAIEVWLWCRVRQWLRKALKKELPWATLRQEKPEGLDMPHEQWLDELSPVDEHDMSFLRDLPERLRPLAECLVAGMNRHEIDRELGIDERARMAMMDELREWYRRDGKGG